MLQSRVETRKICIFCTYITGKEPEDYKYPKIRIFKKVKYQ